MMAMQEQTIDADQDSADESAARRGYEMATAEAISWLQRHYGGHGHAEAVIGPLSRWMANRARQRWGGR